MGKWMKGADEARGLREGKNSEGGKSRQASPKMSRHDQSSFCDILGCVVILCGKEQTGCVGKVWG